MPTLKGSEEALFYIQCFLYLVSSSINVSVFHITWLDTFWKDLIHSEKFESESQRDTANLYAIAWRLEVTQVFIY